MGKNGKPVLGWAFYDWANSAFATTVMAGFFPIFFKSYWSSGVDVNMSTARLGLGNAVASLLVAATAPILGAMADQGSAKKKFLMVFAYLGALSTCSLYLVHKGQWPLALVVYVLGNIGFAGANIFYDALLPGLVGEDRIDFISGLGYAMGYLGGGLLFAINVWMTLKPETFGFKDAAAAVRFSFIMVGVWWGAFTLFTLFWVHEAPSVRAIRAGSLFSRGIRQFMSTFRKVRHLKMVFLFLLAYWCYIDGVDTIIRMAVDYGLSIGFAATDLILALLITQFVGFPAALVFGKLGQRWGAKKSIYLAICCYMMITLWGTMMKDKTEFYLLAVFIGLVQGGIQALSRSYYARLIPADQSAEFYGFYNMLGKFAAIIGPALIGITGLWVRNLLMPAAPTPEEVIQIGQLASRLSIGSVLVLFVAGAVILYFVDAEKGKKEAAYLSAPSE